MRLFHNILNRIGETRPHMALALAIMLRMNPAATETLCIATSASTYHGCVGDLGENGNVAVFNPENLVNVPKALKGHADTIGHFHKLGAKTRVMDLEMLADRFEADFAASFEMQNLYGDALDIAHENRRSMLLQNDDALKTEINKVAHLRGFSYQEDNYVAQVLQGWPHGKIDRMALQDMIFHRDNVELFFDSANKSLKIFIPEMGNPQRKLEPILLDYFMRNHLIPNLKKQGLKVELHSPFNEPGPEGQQENLNFEGGDLHFGTDPKGMPYLIGYAGPRTEREAIENLAIKCNIPSDRVLILEPNPNLSKRQTNTFYHLDTFCGIFDDMNINRQQQTIAIIAEGIMNPKDIERFKSITGCKNILQISQELAQYSMATNSTRVGDRSIIIPDGLEDNCHPDKDLFARLAPQFKDLKNRISHLGVHVELAPLGELMKAGGAVHCCYRIAPDIFNIMLRAIDSTKMYMDAAQYDNWCAHATGKMFAQRTRDLVHTIQEKIFGQFRPRQAPAPTPS